MELDNSTAARRMASQGMTAPGVGALDGDGPIWQQIRRVLARPIVTGEWPPGTRIPTELTLTKRFRTSRMTVGKAIQSLEPEEAEQSPKKNPAAASDSKIDQGIELLRNPKGATLSAIMHATGWQPHSVRGFISGQLKRKRGLKVRSFKRGGERVYALKGDPRGKNR